jgi:single-strand DNA-binding protein
MSYSINRVTVIGNLGNDPQTGVGKNSGVAWASFRLACNESWKDVSGEVHKRTDWVQVVAFNGLAKSLARLASGDQVAVDGRLRSREYVDRGQKRTVVEILATTVQFLKDRPVDDVPAETAAGANLPEDDDIPF